MKSFTAGYTSGLPCVNSKAIGNSTTIFHDFKASADPSKFQPTGLDNCPQASGCQQGLSSMRIAPHAEQMLQDM